MSQVPLPTGSYLQPDLHASCRRLVNCFSEMPPQLTNLDFKQKPPASMALLRRQWGITGFASDGTTNGVRGMWQMASIVYVVIGPTLYTLSASGNLTRLASGIAGGNTPVRMADNTECLVILVPSTSNLYTYTVANGFAPLAASIVTQYGALDIGFEDTYIVFLQVGGRGFYNDDGQTVSGTGPITFTSGAQFPREYGTDPFVGMAINSRVISMFGQRTSEQYVDAGNSEGSPFVSSPNSLMELGCDSRCGLTVAKQNQSVYWVANDLTLRLQSGNQAVRVSNHGSEAVLASANLTGAYALPYTIAGHLMYALQMPAEGRTLVYDCTTTEFHELSSYGLGYWRVQCIFNAFGKQLVGDSQSGQIGYLDETSQTEFGAAMVSSWTTQSVYDANNRIAHRRLELVLGGGFAAIGLIPKVTAYLSDDGGYTWSALPMRTLGPRGQFGRRVQPWTNLGMSSQRVYKFQVSDAVPTFTVDCQAELQGGRF